MLDWPDQSRIYDLLVSNHKKHVLGLFVFSPSPYECCVWHACVCMNRGGGCGKPAVNRHSKHGLWPLLSGTFNQMFVFLDDPLLVDSPALMLWPLVQFPVRDTSPD